MPGTEVVRKQTVLGGAAGIALIAFSLIWRFYPASFEDQAPSVATAQTPVSEPAMTIAQNPALPKPTSTLSKPPKSESETSPSAPQTPAVPPSKAIAGLLKKADQAMATQHYVEPKNGSALALYGQVLAQDKGNTAANDGIEKIYKSILQQADDALDRGDEHESARLIAQLSALPHKSEELGPLQTRLKTLAEVLPLLTRAADALQQGHATAPPRDNALEIYRHVLELDPGNKLADRGLGQIQGKYLDRALAAAAQDDFSGADKFLTEASPIRPGSQQLLDTRTRIESIRREMAANILTQANSALDAGNPDLAESLAKKALGLSPDLGGVDQFNQRLRNARLYANFSPGQIINDKFRDRHGSAPALVVIPTGSFTMGSSSNERGHRPSEEPTRQVIISAGFAMGRDEVSVAQFQTFSDDSGYETNAESNGESSIYDERSGRIITRRGVTWRDDYLGDKAAANLPVVHVSWNDAQAYASWLSARTGKHYRLPSEAEFEYALRAGSKTMYPWGTATPPAVVDNVTGDGDRSPHLRRSWAKAFKKYTDGFWGPAPIGKFPANAFGLIDMDGNVSEWTADCWHDNYTRAPADSSAWINPGCAAHVIRGGSWGSAPDQVRSAYRISAPAATRSPRVGIRVARDL